MKLPANDAQYIRAAINSGKATDDEKAFLDTMLAFCEGGVDITRAEYAKAQRMIGGSCGEVPIVERPGQK